MQEIVTFSGSPPARGGQVYARRGNPVMFIISAQARVVIPDLIRNPAQIPACAGRTGLCEERESSNVYYFRASKGCHSGLDPESSADPRLSRGGQL